MQAIFKRTMLFRSGEKKLTVLASPELQAVPDWVAKTHAFKTALVKPKNGIQAIVLPDGPSRSQVDRENLLKENKQFREEIATLRAQVGTVQPAKPVSAKKQ